MNGFQTLSLTSQEMNTYSNTTGNNTANPDSVRSHVTANDVRPLLDQLLNTGAAAALPV